MLIMENHFKSTRFRPVNGYPVIDELTIRNVIYVPNELPGLEIFSVVAFLEVIHLFQYLNGYGDIILFEILDGIAVIQQYRSIQHVDFLRVFMFQLLLGNHLEKIK